jgi:hypothetical protein
MVWWVDSSTCPFGCLASFCQQFEPIFMQLTKIRTWRMLTLGRCSWTLFYIDNSRCLLELIWLIISWKVTRDLKSGRSGYGRQWAYGHPRIRLSRTWEWQRKWFVGIGRTRPMCIAGIQCAWISRKVVVNNPYKPWVSKFRSSDQKIAADLFIFVDSRKEGWEAAKKAVSTLNHLGIQDAPRKQRDSSQSPGVWAGSVIRTGVGGVSVLTS